LVRIRSILMFTSQNMSIPIRLFTAFKVTMFAIKLIGVFGVRIHSKGSIL